MTPVSGLMVGKTVSNDCLTLSDECLNGSKRYVNNCAEKTLADCDFRLCLQEFDKFLVINIS